LLENLSILKSRNHGTHGKNLFLKFLEPNLDSDPDSGRRRDSKSGYVSSDPDPNADRNYVIGIVRTCLDLDTNFVVVRNVA
jgi:hypothetical protein